MDFIRYFTPMQGEFVVDHHLQSAQIVFHTKDGYEHLFEIYYNMATKTIIFDHFIPATQVPDDVPVLHRYEVTAGLFTLAHIFEHCELHSCLLQWLPREIYQHYDHDLEIVMNTMIDSLDAEKFVMFESTTDRDLSG